MVLKLMEHPICVLPQILLLMVWIPHTITQGMKSCVHVVCTTQVHKAVDSNGLTILAHILLYSSHNMHLSPKKIPSSVQTYVHNWCSGLTSQVGVWLVGSATGSIPRSVFVFCGGENVYVHTLCMGIGVRTAYS